MLEIIAASYPRLCMALRRTAGLSKEESARLIMSARYGARAAAWSADDCARARRLVADAFTSRPRLTVAR